LAHLVMVWHSAACWLESMSGPVSTEAGDRIRVQFPVQDIYLGM